MVYIWLFSLSLNGIKRRFVLLPTAYSYPPLPYATRKESGDARTVSQRSSVVGVHWGFRSHPWPSLKAHALNDPPFFIVLFIASVGSIFCREIDSNHLSCIIFTAATSNPLLMPLASMLFDSCLKIRLLNLWSSLKSWLDHFHPRMMNTEKRHCLVRKYAN